MLLANKKEWSTDTRYGWTSKNLLRRGQSQSRKTAYCIIPLTWKTQKRPDTVGRGDWGITANGLFLGVMKIFWNLIMEICFHLLKHTQLLKKFSSFSSREEADGSHAWTSSKLWTGSMQEKGNPRETDGCCRTCDQGGIKTTTAAWEIRGRYDANHHWEKELWVSFWANEMVLEDLAPEPS